MKKLLGLLLLSSVVLTSCERDKKYITKDEIATFETSINPLVSNIVYIYKEDIYLLKDVNSAPVKITSTPKQRKFAPRISPDGMKVAYLKDDSTAVVVALVSQLGFSAGAVMREFPDFKVSLDTVANGVADYDWVPNINPASSSSLYTLFHNQNTNSDTIKFTEGSDLARPNFIFDKHRFHSIAFDPEGTFYFLMVAVGEDEEDISLYKLAKGSPSPKRMKFVDALTKDVTPLKEARIACNQNGDLILKTGRPGNYDAYYIYPKGSITSIKLPDDKEAPSGMLDIYYNGGLNQTVMYGYNPNTYKTEFTVWNLNTFARAKNTSIAPPVFKTDDPNGMQFNWK